MKHFSKISLAIVIAFCAADTYPQSPQTFSYQAVARDSAGNLIANQNISLRFTIHQQTEPFCTVKFTTR